MLKVKQISVCLKTLSKCLRHSTYPNAKGDNEDRNTNNNTTAGLIIIIPGVIAICLILIIIITAMVIIKVI